MDQELAEGYQGQFRELKALISVFCLYFMVYGLLGTRQPLRESFSATNVVMYSKSLIPMCRVANSSVTKKKPQKQAEYASADL